jgi:hypothetical protein
MPGAVSGTAPTQELADDALCAGGRLLHELRYLRGFGAAYNGNRAIVNRRGPRAVLRRISDMAQIVSNDCL